MVLTNEPLKHVLGKPDQSGRLSKWAIELSEYDIGYQAPSAKKAQVLADFLLDYPEETEGETKSPQEDVSHLIITQVKDSLEE